MERTKRITYRVKSIDQGFSDISLLSLRHVDQRLRNHFADKYQGLKQYRQTDRLTCWRVPHKNSLVTSTTFYIVSTCWQWKQISNHDCWLSSLIVYDTLRQHMLSYQQQSYSFITKWLSFIEKFRKATPCQAVGGPIATWLTENMATWYILHTQTNRH